MKKENAVKLVGFFIFVVALAIVGLAMVRSESFSQVLSSPPLGAGVDKEKIYRIKVKRTEAKSNKAVMGFSAETAKTLGIDGEADLDRDLEAAPSEGGMDDYSEVLKKIKNAKAVPVKSEYDYNTVRAELDRIKAAEAKAQAAEAAAIKKQNQKEKQKLLEAYKRERGLQKNYKRDIDSEIKTKYQVRDDDYEYEGLTE